MAARPRAHRMCLRPCACGRCSGAWSNCAQTFPGAQREVAWAVGRLPNPRARTLMEMRYLSCLTWDEIAQALYASPRAALRMHQRALRQVDILLAEREDCR